MGLIIPLVRAKAFLAWVSKFPHMGLKIPLSGSQKSLDRVSKFPPVGLKNPPSKRRKPNLNSTLFGHQRLLKEETLRHFDRHLEESVEGVGGRLQTVEFRSDQNSTV